MGRGGGRMGGYGETVILFGTYNISNGINSVLESVLRVMSQSNLDLGLFNRPRSQIELTCMCQRVNVSSQ